VAASDAVVELLEQVQLDFGEGPCVAAFAEDRVVAVEDLAAAPAWDRLAVVVAGLRVRGVLSVPVRLAGQPVGTLDVCATQPRGWAVEEAVAAFATLTAELVRTGVELAARELEVAQLRGALANRVWVEQAKGVLAATEGVTPEAAFGRLRARARASRRRVADPAREVVQEAQRARVAALAVDDVRVRAAEARVEQAEAALGAAQVGLARRSAALDRAQDEADDRERAADARERAAGQRDRASDDPAWPVGRTANAVAPSWRRSWTATHTISVPRQADRVSERNPFVEIWEWRRSRIKSCRPRSTSRLGRASQFPAGFLRPAPESAPAGR
jgi:GAF domain-containing protein